MVSLLDVRAAFERHYRGSANLSRRAGMEYLYRIGRWERFAGVRPVNLVTTDVLCRARAAMLAAGLSADTIESTVDAVLQVLRCCQRLGMLGSVPHPGRRLRLSKSRRYVPPLDDLGKVYAVADAARWPLFCRPGDFWRPLLAFAYWTGLRHGDLFWSARWSDLAGSSISVTAHKTGKAHVFPRCPAIDRHLEAAPRKAGDGRLFPVGICRKQILREMRRLCDAAQVRAFGLHAVRRLACTEWQAARWGAGEVLQGKSLGVCDRYIVPRLLEQAAPSVRWPAAMLTAAEREQLASDELRAIVLIRRLDSTSRSAVLSLAERLAN